MLSELFEFSANFLGIKQQSYQRGILQEISLATRCCIIQGDRGIGKTTALVQYLLKQAQNNRFDPDILYIPADHFLMANKTLYEVAEEFTKLGGKHLAIDEIHKYPNWSMELKSINDTFMDLKVLVTGSSALKIFQGSHDLGRRALIYKMFGLSFREYLELKLDQKFTRYDLDQLVTNHQTYADNIINLLKKDDIKVLVQFQEYLLQGYYPYSLELDNINTFQLTLEQSIHTIIESDLASIHPSLTGHSIKKIKQLLAYIASNVPFVPNWSKLKSLLEVGDERTLKNYFTYLEDAALIRTVLKSTSKLSKLENSEKIFLYNTNIASAITVGDTNKGNMRETFFLSMLSNRYQASLPCWGDFQIDPDYIFEIGGRKKDFNQISGTAHAYLALDDIEIGSAGKIPLWLFGFLY
jgi:predicted AAA+ superfamily ATPase